jgi:hypothetical protein
MTNNTCQVSSLCGMDDAGLHYPKRGESHKRLAPPRRGERDTNKERKRKDVEEEAAQIKIWAIVGNRILGLCRASTQKF